MTSDKAAAALRKLGLDEKEAKVYIANLELGPSPVQKIARRASVPRATTYLVLDALKEKGLVTTFEHGKKIFFAAESPEQFKTIVADRDQEVKQQQAVADEIIPELLGRGQFRESSRPAVRYYDGPQALGSYIRDILAGPGSEARAIFCHDEAERLLERAGISWDEVAKKRQTLSPKIKRWTIYTWRHTAPAAGFHTGENLIYVPYGELPGEAEITIKGNVVGFVPYSEPIRAVIIQDKAIAAILRLMFDNMWAYRSRKKS